MRAGIVQFTPEHGQVAANRRRAAGLVRQANVELAVLPELAFTGYVFRDRDELASLAEPADGETAQFMAALAHETGATICYGFPERDGERLFNAAALVGPRGLIAVYRKIHLFLDETRLFTPGDRPFFVVEAAGARLGMMICFDWHFPESARSLALQGAQILLHPANLVLPFCQDAMITRCLENRVFVLTANRGGAEPRRGRELRFTGRSQIARPDGSFDRLPGTDDGVLTAKIEPAAADDKRLTPANDLWRDRRPEMYAFEAAKRRSRPRR